MTNRSGDNIGSYRPSRVFDSFVKVQPPTPDKQLSTHEEFLNGLSAYQARYADENAQVMSSGSESGDSYAGFDSHQRTVSSFSNGSDRSQSTIRPSSPRSQSQSQNVASPPSPTDMPGFNHLTAYQQVLPQVRSPVNPTSTLGLAISGSESSLSEYGDRETLNLGTGGSVYSAFSPRSFGSSSSVSTATFSPRKLEHTDSFMLTQSADWVAARQQQADEQTQSLSHGHLPPSRLGGRLKSFGFTGLEGSPNESGASSEVGSREVSPDGRVKGGLEITSLKYGRRDSHTKNGESSSSLLARPTGLSRNSSYSSEKTVMNSPPTTPASAPLQMIPRRHKTSRANSGISSFGSTVGFEAKAVRQTPLSPRLPPGRVNLSTRTSAERNEGALKLNLEGIRPAERMVTSSLTSAPTRAALLRKKSGELVKPSLKATSSYSDVSSLAGPPSTMSLPTTPGFPKYVHFDTQLEKVKLFLHDQRPEIVSRNGSPNEYYTTSEGESEYPFPATDEESELRKTVLEIRLPNFPTSHSHDADLYLESIFLDDDRKTLRGIVKVRNMSFQKWLAVRFTYDWWQTTSEVTATHKESVDGGSFDRFQFSLKLSDMLAKIEEKTLFIALRYNTEGREVWDNNGGSNYHVTFVKVPVVAKVGSQPARPAANGLISPGMGRSIGGRSSQWDVAGRRQDRMADLRAKLNKLSEDESNNPLEFSSRRPMGSPSKRGLGLPGSSSTTKRVAASGLNTDPSKEAEAPSIGSPLGARYSFGASFQNDRGGRKTSPDSRARELPPKMHALRPSMEFYSPKLGPAGLDQQRDHSISPPTTFSPNTLAQGNARLELPTPNVTIQEPSPPFDYFTPAAPSAVTAPIIPSSATPSVIPTLPNKSSTALPRMYADPPFKVTPASSLKSAFKAAESHIEDVTSTESSPVQIQGDVFDSSLMGIQSPPSIASSVTSDTDSPTSPAAKDLPDFGPHQSFSVDDFGKMAYSSILEK